jgi:serine/threonine protein phosphatase PrpC
VNSTTLRRKGSKQTKPLIPLLSWDRFLLTTDGIHAVVDEVRMSELLRTASTPRVAVAALLDAALKAGGEDNVTALLVDT